MDELNKSMENMHAARHGGMRNDPDPMEVSEAARLHERMGRVSGLAYLQRAKKRIEDPLCWVKGAPMTDRKGIPCGGERAVRFSLLGAMEKEYDGSPEFTSAMHSIQHTAGDDLQKWNDRWWRTHASVMNALERAMGIEIKK